MPSRDNAAQRLHALLAVAARQSRDVSVLEAWRRVFGDAHARDAVRVFGRLQELSALADETEALLRSIKGINHGLYLEPLTAIRAALNTTNLDVPWGSVLERLTPEVIRGLAHAVDRIGESFTWQAIEAEELKALAKDLDELFEQVSAAQIGEPLRTILLRLVEAMRRSISEYRIGGTDGVVEAVARAIGVLFINRDNVKSEADRSIVERFLETLGKIQGALAKVRPYLPAIRVAAKYYLPEGTAEIVNETLPR